MAPSLAPSPFALLVEPTPSHLMQFVSALSAAGFQLKAVNGYLEAAELLTVQLPLLLMTEVRLGDYNGLQLVLRGKSVRPSMAALVTSSVHDVVLRREAEQMGATFLDKPIAEAELIAAAFRTLVRDQAGAPPLRPPFERRVSQRRTAVGTVDWERRQAERRADTLAIVARMAAR